MATSLSNDSLKGHVLLAKSTAYSFKADYDKSTQYSLEALQFAERFKDTTLILDGYNNLGIDFMYREEFKKSHEYFLKYKELAELSSDSLRLGHGLNNLGMVEYYLGNEDRELQLYQEAKIIFKKINEQEGLGNTLLNIGTVQTANGEYGSAHESYIDALTIFEEIGYISGYCNTLQSMAENYMEQGQYDKALSTANKALQLLQDNNLRQDVLYTFELIKNIYEQKNDFVKAYEYQTKYYELNDELFNEQKALQINELTIQYETAKKEAEIERLAFDNELQQLEISKAKSRMFAFIIIAGIVIAASIFVFILRNKKNAAERLAQESQLDALKQRILQLQIENSDELTIDYNDINGKIATPLTDREFETLSLSLKGKSNQEIADQLFVSINTVKFHLRNIYQKLGVSNKKEALEYVVKSS